MKKSFIQTPLLVYIIVGILVLGGAGYFGIKQYQISQVEKIERATQQKSLELAQTEIETLKQESGTAKAKQQQLEQEVANEQQKSKAQNLSISASELEPYLTGVQEITCYDSKGGYSTGSGSLWFLKQQYVILTNKHVVELGKCEVDPENTDRITTGFYGLDTQKMYSENPETDSTFVPIKIDPSINPDVESAPLSTLNYKVSSLNRCPAKMPIGSPVILIGYPIYARKKVDGSSHIQYKVTTNGIISGYDEYLVGKYANYFVSAKIDSGNSGGIALSKNLNGLCLLGIPTWLTVGNYETQGVVQNIHNVKYKE